jgi:Phosphotransferase enzyme family
MDERVAAAAGRPVRSLRRIQTRGYATAFHAIAEFADGSTAFVKAGAEEVTSRFLRDELRVYQAVEGPFMAKLLGYDEADPPLLVLEDLSAAHWPPPWHDEGIAAVRKTLTQVWSTVPPEWLPAITEERERLLGGWAEVEADPEPFLSLGLCSPQWLDEALPVLRRAAETAPIEGDALIHLDVRSDNIALTDRGAVLVDWNFAHRGNPEFDLAAWLPSLELEGGPPPERTLPAAGRHAAALAGFWGSRAGLPPPPTAPQVRRIQRDQLEVALAWACRELELRFGQ